MSSPSPDRNGWLASGDRGTGVGGAAIVLKLAALDTATRAKV